MSFRGKGRREGRGQQKRGLGVEGRDVERTGGSRKRRGFDVRDAGNGGEERGKDTERGRCWRGWKQEEKKQSPHPKTM